MTPPLSKPASRNVPWTVAVPIILSTIGILMAAGTMRWSWLLLDEQIALRKDFEELRNEQRQANIQYEFWLGKVQQERDAMRQADAQ